jgi:hypothetical protein
MNAAVTVADDHRTASGHLDDVVNAGEATGALVADQRRGGRVRACGTRGG